MATLFYEPSTRTRLSFEAAMKRLGGEVLTTKTLENFLQLQKEKLLKLTYDQALGLVPTYNVSKILIMTGFDDVIKNATVVFKYDEGGICHLNEMLCKRGSPLIGPFGQVYTIGREVGQLDGIKLGLVGDLANGRTVRSLAYLIAKYQDVKIYFISPDIVKMKDDIKDHLTSMGVAWESTDLLDVASKCDVIYQTRIQRKIWKGSISTKRHVGNTSLTGKFLV
ncbi:hypothetical protein HPP92_018526 [Vanilla planifolia]|uniref:Uncharacterized protein n=1 Tax=Vanilla planifolia TaxID=51239 RepID=A0A835UPG5_VANPL|nr:hypothetical protein HPP92_018526 [Vanilla planifolia]